MLTYSVGQNLDRDSGASLSLLHLHLGPQLEDWKAECMFGVDAGYQLEASVSSSRDLSPWTGLGFLTTWWEPDRSHVYVNDQASEVMQHHFPCIPFTEAVKVPSRFKGKRNRLSLLMVNGKIPEEHMDWKYCCNHFED